MLVMYETVKIEATKALLVLYISLFELKIYHVKTMHTTPYVHQNKLYGMSNKDARLAAGAVHTHCLTDASCIYSELLHGVYTNPRTIGITNAKLCYVFA